jgi:hypothetical protein
MFERALRILARADRSRDLTVKHVLAEEAGNLLQQVIVINREQSVVHPRALAALGDARGLLGNGALQRGHSSIFRYNCADFASFQEMAPLNSEGWVCD